MKAALFLTTELEPARALLRGMRARHKGMAWVVFVRDEHRGPLAADLAGTDVRRDKPAGSRVTFLRALRAEGFGLLVVAWHGGERPQPLRAVAWLSGAGRAVAVDETGREIPLSVWRPWGVLAHAARRLRRMKAMTAARLVCAAYRATVGLVVGTLWLGAAVMWALVRRGGVSLR